MRVCEIFESWQGEFPCGLVCLFIRLQGCNQRCEYCDTPQAQDPKGGVEMSLQDVAQKIIDSNRRNIVVTGGEPMLQWEELWKLMRSFVYGYNWYIETNGTIDDVNLNFFLHFERIVVSPKTPRVASKWVNNSRAILKIVVDPSNEEQFSMWVKWFKKYTNKLRCEVLFMPLTKFETQEFATQEFANLKLLIERLKKLKLPIGFSPRLQWMFEFK
jgi:organic radical activating enzyme